MICVFKELIPEMRFHIECVKSILSGDEVCCHRIIIDDYFRIKLFLLYGLYIINKLSNY